MQFEQAVRSHVGCRRQNNEDAVLARPECGLWAVADGMGGHAAGDVASALVMEKLTAAGAGGVAAVRAAIADANLTLWQAGSEKGRTMGSTVVALVLEPGGYCCLWAGDSRAYLQRGGGLTQLTRDHSLVQQLVDAGDLAPDAAASHPNANIITRAVGSTATLELDHADGVAHAGDVFLLASDGLTRLLREDEIASAGSEADLERVADHWVDTVLSRGAPDNLSLVLVRVKAI
jgi:serine/threonine protein phosphatase PrpC